MANFAVVDSAGQVINRIVLDEGADWSPEDGHSIVEDTATSMEIGGSLIKGKYTPPYREPPIAAAVIVEDPRDLAMRSDQGAADLLNKLNNASLADIDKYVNSADTVAKMQTLMKALLKAVALNPPA